MRKLRWTRELEETYDDGEYIVREGEATRQMYVIQEGQVAITKRVGNADQVLATLGKGDFFGEMSLLESLPRDANARAVGRTRLLIINPGGLLVRIRRDPTFALEMLQRLSGRVRTMNQIYVQSLLDAHAYDADQRDETEGAGEDDA